MPGCRGCRFTQNAESRRVLGVLIGLAGAVLLIVCTVVGVSGDFATSQLTTEWPQMLLPLPDLSSGALAKAETLAPTMLLIVRGAAGDEPKLKSALENVLRELGLEALPGVAFSGVVTGPDLVEKSFGDLMTEGTVVGFAGGIVLVLAALGIVGVVGFMVATRTRELALRMALGATRPRVFRLVISDGVKLAIPGVAGGSTSLGVMEPVIYAGAATIAVLVALLAGFPAAPSRDVRPAAGGDSVGVTQVDCSHG